MVIQAFRDNIPKWLTGIILVLIIGPFALWGINSYFSASTDTSVAKVNGSEISPQDFQQAYQRRYEQMQQQLGAAFKPEMIDEKQLRQEVLRQLVNSTLLDQQVAKQHYAIGNADLVAAVQQIPAFQVDGKFSTQAYQATLTANGLTPAAFEERERQDLVVTQLQNAVMLSAFATPQQLEINQQVQGEEREIGYLTIAAAPYLKSATVSGQELAAYYQAHAKEFMTPEKLTLAYVELDEAQLAKSVTATDEQLQALYQQQLASFGQGAAREAQHILIAVGGKDAKTDAAANAKAQDILKQLKAGADFATLARQYSDDAGSAANGGNLGWITRGSTDKSFEDALFGIAKVGGLVGPVKLADGYDIIKLDGIRAPSTKSFAEVRSQLLAQYQQKKADDEYFALGDQLANLAYEHPDSLQAVSKQLNLPIQTVNNVTRDNGSGIAADPTVRQKAFSDEVLTQGNNSDPIKIGPNHVVVIRVQGHVPSTPESLAAVRDRISAMLKQQQAMQQARKVAGKVQAALDSGKSAAQVAASFQLKFTPGKFVTRNDASVPAAVLSAAFAAPPPGNKALRAGVVTLPGGDQAVFEVSAMKTGGVSGWDKAQRIAGLQQLMRANAQAEFFAYLETLRQHAKVKINSANIQE
ncbi:MAG TPA: SurA N-terminal domain-containing protein [Gammaproteobacteria bacterium]|nr:SurA N-terminal domain-containing protein [Gammaproteobacteria bacterium]